MEVLDLLRAIEEDVVRGVMRKDEDISTVRYSTHMVSRKHITIQSKKLGQA